MNGPITREQIEDRYPQTLNDLTRVRVADLAYLYEAQGAVAWVYWPLRAAEGLSSLSQILRAQSADLDPPCYEVKLTDGRQLYLLHEDFVYVNESTFSMIQNYH